MGRLLPRRSSSGGASWDPAASGAASASAAAASASTTTASAAAVASASASASAINRCCSWRDTTTVTHTLSLLERVALQWREDTTTIGKSLLHDSNHSNHASPSSSSSSLALKSAWLTRLLQLEMHYNSYSTSHPHPQTAEITTKGSNLSRKNHSHNHHYCSSSSRVSSSSHHHDHPPSTRFLRAVWMTQPDLESGYTPLHEAVWRGDLATILLLLRHAVWETTSTAAFVVAESASPSTTTTTSTAESRFVDNTTTTEPQQDWERAPLDSISLIPPRLAFRPMEMLSGDGLLFANTSSSSSRRLVRLQSITTAVDHEGMNAHALLAARQVHELCQCRRRAVYRPITRQCFVSSAGSTTTWMPYSDRFSCGTHHPQRQDPSDHSSTENDNDEQDLADHGYRGDEVEDDQDENENEQELTERSNTTSSYNAPTDDSSSHYGCEVFTFGRAYHCALGVVVGGSSAITSTSSIATKATTTPTECWTTSTSTLKTSPRTVSHSHSLPTTTSHRPQRIQAFSAAARGTSGRNHPNSHDCKGGGGSATAIAGAAHHSLIVTRDGHVYACGFGKGGRLGTGDETHRPVPIRIMGALVHQQVVSVAAAENHSLCVTQCGHVYAWGSNRFGQLGTTCNSTTTTTTTTTPCTTMMIRCVPRRVDDLKQSVCVAVAAGAKHSVALTQQGEVYVWGDNSSGQLGNSRRNGLHKVHRVDALWNCSYSSNSNSRRRTAKKVMSSSNHRTMPRRAIAIAASDQATLVLTLPSGDSELRENEVYSWGHGTHSPSKVHFDTSRSYHRSRVVNPVCIACALYHNVAVMSDGLVYTWGLHEEPLGKAPKSTKSMSPVVSASTRSNPSRIASPQLVTGMLPENGGGFVVGVSASENHTVVITDSGAVFTWGATYGKNILGHEGVRWQPDPKRVPGVYRAVGVAAAKEHTILLIGTSFPPLPSLPIRNVTLEHLAVRVIAEQVDLFNVIPSLIMAERCQSNELIAYCEEFVRKNLDGVLNVGQKSAMNCYLDEQLTSSGLFTPCDDDRDDRIHPLIMEIVLAANPYKAESCHTSLSHVCRWLPACAVLADRYDVQSWLRKCSFNSGKVLLSSSKDEFVKRKRSGSVIVPDTDTTDRVAHDCGCSARCIALTQSMDLASKELAQSQWECLSKEIRSTRKRLSQISKLQHSVSSELRTPTFTADERAKIARRSQLEADLREFEPALKAVEQRLYELALEICAPAPCESCIESKESTSSIMDPSQPNLSSDSDRPTAFRCSVCRIACPDATSYALHMNGRKHRNRLSQVEEDEKASVAASILKEKEMEQIMLNPLQPDASKNGLKQPPTAWLREKPNHEPLYKLPSPPVPIPDSMVHTPSPKKMSLRDIMQEESKLYSSASSSCSPKWKSIHSPSSHASIIRQPASTTTSSLDNIMSPLTSARSPTCQVHTSAVRLAWGCTPTPLSKSADTTTHHRIQSNSLLDIQDQERDFKLRQDKTTRIDDSSKSTHRKWFVQQRERAASIHEIQKVHEEEREMRLFVEDQVRIEQQIIQELEDAQKKVKSKRKMLHAKSNQKKVGAQHRDYTPKMHAANDK